MFGLFFSVISSVVVSVSEFTSPGLSSPRLLSRLLSRSPWFLSERPFCGRSPLWNLCPPSFLPGGPPVTSVSSATSFHHHGYFCYRICRFFQIFRFLVDLSGLSASFRTSVLCSFCCLASLSPLWACASSADAFCDAERSETTLPDKTLFTLSVFPIRIPDGFLRIFFLCYHRSVHSADVLHARYSFLWCFRFCVFSFVFVSISLLI